MSATPIPRTLALVLYENMNYIKIPDKPSSQKRTKSAVYSDHKRQKVYELVQDHLDKGIQTYWVCTRVEDTTDDTLQSVKMFSEIIKNQFTKYKTAVLHGKVSSDEKKLELKAPLGNILTIEMPVQDVTLRLDQDLASDQALMTTSNVSFREIKVDTSFSKHVGLPSYSQQNDAIASGKGWLSAPWIYTNAIESYANIHDANTSGVFVGASPFADNHQVAMATFGESRLLVD